MAPKSSSHGVDALAWLARDHRAVKRLFQEYERAVHRQAGDDVKGLLVGQICLRLSGHLQVEEEAFYPAVRAALGQVAPLVHALLDHRGTRELIARLDEMEPGDADHDPAVAVLAAYVLPHMAEEEQAIFPLLRAAGLDTAALGRRLAERRRTLHEDVTRIGMPLSAGHAGWPGVFCMDRQSLAPGPAANWR